MAKRGRPRKNPTYKVTIHAELDYRDRGRKSDQQLLADYFQLQKLGEENGFGRTYSDSHCEPPERPWTIRQAMKVIEMEIGKDRIQDERIRLLEEKADAIENDQAPPKWVIPTLLCSVGVSAIVTLAFHFL